MRTVWIVTAAVLALSATPMLLADEPKQQSREIERWSTPLISPETLKALADKDGESAEALSAAMAKNEEVAKELAQKRADRLAAFDRMREAREAQSASEWEETKESSRELRSSLEEKLAGHAEHQRERAKDLREKSAELQQEHFEKFQEKLEKQREKGLETAKKLLGASSEKSGEDGAEDSEGGISLGDAAKLLLLLL